MNDNERPRNDMKRNTILFTKKSFFSNKKRHKYTNIHNKQQNDKTYLKLTWIFCFVSNIWKFLNSNWQKQKHFSIKINTEGSKQEISIFLNQRTASDFTLFVLFQWPDPNVWIIFPGFFPSFHHNRLSYFVDGSIVIC